MKKLLLFCFLVLFSGIVLAYPDTGSQKVDIRRAKLHDDIDKLQESILATDGKKDDLIFAVKDEDVNLIITDLMIRQVNILQDSLENHSKLDHRLKVKYLTGLQNIVLSGATALHLRGLLRWVPPAVFISQERGAAPPTAPYVPVRVRSVDRDVLQGDTQLKEYSGVWARTSNPGRAAAELFADRHAIGVAACVSVIVELCADGVLDSAEVLKHARRLHCLTEMKALLGVACG